MAEGGEDPGDNPFSYRNFSKSKKKSPSDTLAGASSDDREDVYDMPDVQNIGGNDEERTRRPTTADDDRHRRKDDNPFSFKKFLKSNSRPKAPSGGLATLDLANDLPDFIQDHSASPACSDRRPRIPPPDVPLPDFALDSSASSAINPAATGGFEVSAMPELDGEGMHLQAGHHDYPDTGQRHRPFGFLSNSPPDIGGNGHMSNSDAEDEDPDGILEIPQANATGGLPDFLSDSAVNSVDMRSMDNPMALANDFMYHANGDYDLELRKVREENRELRQQLTEARQLAETESQRVAEVLREMDTVQKREAAETAALENMVLQVEANLTTTTQRAVHAENTVAKLKQEVRSLKAQLQVAGTQPNTTSPANDVVKEKAKYAAEQLSTAARNAEQTLQQLMSGVETLRLVSSVLSSIDKVTDAGADGDTDQPAEGATGGGAAL